MLQRDLSLQLHEGQLSSFSPFLHLAIQLACFLFPVCCCFSSLYLLRTVPFGQEPPSFPIISIRAGCCAVAFPYTSPPKTRMRNLDGHKVRQGDKKYNEHLITKQRTFPLSLTPNNLHSRRGGKTRILAANDKESMYTRPLARPALSYTSFKPGSGDGPRLNSAQPTSPSMTASRCFTVFAFLLSPFLFFAGGPPAPAPPSTTDDKGVAAPETSCDASSNLPSPV